MVAITPLIVTVAIPEFKEMAAELIMEEVEEIPFTSEVKVLIKEERELLLMTPEEIVEVTPLTAEERV